jgi:hypothetical protein
MLRSEHVDDNGHAVEWFTLEDNGAAMLLVSLDFSLQNASERERASAVHLMQAAREQRLWARVLYTPRYSVCLPYWYKITHTDATTAMHVCTRTSHAHPQLFAAHAAARKLAVVLAIRFK